MEKYERLHRAMSELIEISKESQNQARKIYENHFNAFAKEICTIVLGCARRSGHTGLINTLIKERFPNALVLFPNLKLCDNYTKKYGLIQNASFSPIQCAEWNIPENVDAVIVDGSYFISEKSTEKIYKKLSDKCKKEFYFIFLQ